MTLGLSKRRLASDAAVTQSGRGLQVVFSVITVVILARALGPTQFGVFSTIVAVQTACFAIADLGLGQLALRAVAQQRTDEASAIRAAMPYLYIASSVVVGVSCIISLVLVGGAVTTVAASLLIGSAYTHAAARIGVERGFWLGALRFGRATIIDVTIAFLRAAAVGAVWLAGGATLLSYSVGLAVSGLLTLLVMSRWLVYPSTAPASVVPTDVMMVVRGGAPFALSSLTWNSFTELPKIMLASAVGAAAVGQYAAGARFLMAAYVPLQSLMLVMTPRLFAFAGEAPRKTPGTTHPLIKAAALTTLVGGTLAILISGFAPLLPVLLGETYRPSVPVLRVLSISLPFQALAFATGDWLGGVGRQQLRLVLTLVTALLAVPASYLASRHAGALGAAASYSALTAVIAVATAVASRRYLPR